MLCSIFEVQLYENDMLLCTTDFISKQNIISIDLTTYEEKVIYTNNFLTSFKDDWIINCFQRNDNGLYIGNISTKNNQVGKTIYYDFNKKELQETKSDVLYGRTPFINDNMLFHDLGKWGIYKPSENKFYNVEIVGEYKDEYIYPNFNVLNNNTILVGGENNKYYIGTLNF